MIPFNESTNSIKLVPFDETTNTVKRYTQNANQLHNKTGLHKTLPC